MLGVRWLWVWPTFYVYGCYKAHPIASHEHSSAENDQELCMVRGNPVDQTELMDQSLAMATTEGVDTSFTTRCLRT